MNKEIWRKPLKACDVGGEALIEGVMMRGNGKMAVAVRMPDGRIDVEVSDYVSATRQHRFLRLPFVRGAASMVESMVVGVRVLMNSAEKVEHASSADAGSVAADSRIGDTADSFADDAAELASSANAGTGAAGNRIGDAADSITGGADGKPVPVRGAAAAVEEEEDKFDRFMRKLLGDNYFQYMLYGSVAIALMLGIGLFMLLPNFVTDLLPFDKSGARGAFLANLVEGGFRVLLFLGYIWIVSRNKEIRRVFQYHGAEHKSIYTLESMEPLTVENARRHTTLHPRCGTTFLFVVMLISIVVFMFAGWHNRLVNMALRLVLLPVIAGISYEAFKLAARTDFKPLRALSMPGLMLQKITTVEPDDDMLEVALSALRAVAEEPAADTSAASNLPASQSGEA